MPLTEEQCFEIAIALVKQHNKEDLLTTFQEILNQLFKTSEIALYNIIDNTVVPDTTKNRAQIEQCLVSHKTVFDQQNSLFVLPIRTLGKTNSIITIQDKVLNQHINLLEQLVQLFNNQQLLLDNNNHDALTGLLNRYAFETRISHIIDSYQRREAENKPQYCFAILDIDLFKNVNDNFGHLYGDEVLILFANIMETTFRHDDMLFRYGGEEFSVLLKDINLDNAISVLDRFRKNVAQYDFPQVGRITVSLGVTEITTGVSRVDIISRADQALYYSKQHGRNQVNCFETLLSTGALVEQEANIEDIELF